MAKFDFEYGSDQILDIMIHNAQEKLSLLYELKERRTKDKVNSRTHFSVSFTPVKGKTSIAEVECNCGKITRYRKPLNLIEDFICPEDKDVNGSRSRSNTGNSSLERLEQKPGGVQGSRSRSKRV